MFITIKDKIINLDNVIEICYGLYPYSEDDPIIWFDTVTNRHIVLHFDSVEERDRELYRITEEIYKSL